MFSHMSVCPQGGWYPSMPCRFPGPHPGGKLRGLAKWGGGLQAHTQGISWGVWPGVGSPGPHRGGGSPGPHPGGCIPACTEADPPPTDSYWNAFLSSFFLFIFTAQLWDKIILDGGCHYCVGSLTRAQISFTKMVFISADDFSLVATK